MKNGNYYIAIDLGAESGRIIVGIFDGSKISTEEIHRFPTKQFVKNGTVYWDIEFIFTEIVNGLIKAAAKGYDEPRGIGVDSWGVDFGLLDKYGKLLENPVAYRDKRTEGIPEKVFNLISQKEIYEITGIQLLQFNTIYQLYSLVLKRTELLKKAKTFLMIPDLINYFLTGDIFNEYTNATTTSLLNARTKKYEVSLMQKLSIPAEIMQEIVPPGTRIGEVKKEILEKTGLKKATVFAVGSHDTASAIAAVPAKGENWAYLSSGTWSLLGIELTSPILNERALKFSFTNEGGVDNTIRFLKNIMGLWILQKAKQSLEKKYGALDYSELVQLAEKAEPFQAYFDPDDKRFFNPDDMLTELITYFRETGQKIPESKGGVVRSIFESLAFKTAYYLKQIEAIKGKKIKTLYVVGGGVRNRLLNQLISNVCGVKVILGPVEGTATGNIMTQVFATGEVSSLAEIRDIINFSFEIKSLEPQKGKFEEEFTKFEEQINKWSKK